MPHITSLTTQSYCHLINQTVLPLLQALSRQVLQFMCGAVLAAEITPHAKSWSECLGCFKFGLLWLQLIWSTSLELASSHWQGPRGKGSKSLQDIADAAVTGRTHSTA